MNCTEFDSLVEGVLEGESRPDAHAHLGACARCQRLIADLTALGAAARDLPDLEPSDELWARVRAEALREGLWQEPGLAGWFGLPWSQSVLRPAFAGVLTLALLLAGGTLFTPDETVEPSIELVAQGELIQDVRYAHRFETHLQNVEERVLEEAPPAEEDRVWLAAVPLGTVDRAIEQTQLHLASYPDDPLAREELNRLYRQKVVVLQAMADPTW
jgi:hypothetical protein